MLTLPSSEQARRDKTTRTPLLTVGVAAGLCVVSVATFWFLYRRGMTNLYLDGVAHVNIARKVIDHPDSSIWQRYIQIGTPWLPLQTVLILPFVANDWMWRTGAAGSLVSMASFVAAALALCGIAANLYPEAGWSARGMVVAAFALNPSALYMQATPMSELPFMAALALAVYGFQRWNLQRTPRRLVTAGVMMAAATLARYEAWPVAAGAALLVGLFSSGGMIARAKAVIGYSLPITGGLAYWLWHNWAIYGDPLAFATGPHSARGILAQNQALQGWASVFVGNGPASIALVGTAAAVCAGPLLLLMAGTGLLNVVIKNRRTPARLAPLALLGIPFLFQALSLYRGEIQIFPFSAFGLLNVRYGLPHLMAISLLLPAAARALCRSRPLGVALVSSVVAAQYGLLLSEGPAQLAVHQEAVRNGVNSPPAREIAKASAFLVKHPRGSGVLMYTGALGPVVPRGGLRFSQIIHEGTVRWHELDDAIPNDIFTVIVKDGDPLDSRIRSNAPLEIDLARRFQCRFSTERIRLLERVAD